MNRKCRTAGRPAPRRAGGRWLLALLGIVALVVVGMVSAAAACPPNASLKVVKHVVGGTATADKFTIKVDAAGDHKSFAGNESGTTVSIPPGHYAVTEESGGPAHYDPALSSGCDGTAAPGASITCTITNTYTPPLLAHGTIVIVKKTVPELADEDFTFTLAPVAEEGVTPPAEHIVLNAHDTPTASRDVDPGRYTITEQPTEGWRLAAVICAYDHDPDVGPATVTVRAHRTVTCTFTNVRLPMLTVVKKVVGGAASPSAFTMHVDAAGTSADTSFAGDAKGTSVAVPEGAYSVTESGGPANYTATFSTGCSGTIAVGDEVTCTVTNTYTPPTTTTVTPPAETTVTVAPSPKVDLKVTKAADPSTVPVGALVTYTVTVVNQPLAAGTSFTATDVTLVEPLPAGVTFVLVSPSQGSCTQTAAEVVCKLGSLEPAQMAAVVLKVRPTSPGKLVNSAAALAAEPEVNPADNSATAVVTVLGPFKPPAVCAVLRIRPISLQVGKGKAIVVTVRDQRGKALVGALVTVRGPGILVRGRTSAAGVFARVLHPKKPGVLIVHVPGGSVKCIGRVGVVGVFQPPVTG